MSPFSLKQKKAQRLSDRKYWSMLTIVNSFAPCDIPVNNDIAMDIMMEETFGPVVGIMKVESDEEALGLMNDSPYGLVCLHQNLTPH